MLDVCAILSSKTLFFLKLRHYYWENLSSSLVLNKHIGGFVHLSPELLCVRYCLPHYLAIVWGHFKIISPESINFKLKQVTLYRQSVVLCKLYLINVFVVHLSHVFALFNPTGILSRLF